MWPLPLQRYQLALSLAIWRPLHRHPRATRRSCRGQGLSVGHRREVIALPASRSNFAENATIVSGVSTGFLSCCHTVSFHEQVDVSPVGKTPAIAKPFPDGLRSTFLNVSWGQTSPGIGGLPRLLGGTNSQWPFSCELDIHGNTISSVFF